MIIENDDFLLLTIVAVVTLIEHLHIIASFEYNYHSLDLAVYIFLIRDLPCMLYLLNRNKILCMSSNFSQPHCIISWIYCCIRILHTYTK